MVFTSSEGEGGLLADDLADALETIIGLEWHDCLSFSGGGDLKVIQVSAQHLEQSHDKHNPDIDKAAAQVASALSLRLVPVTDLVIRLQAAASKTEPDYVVTGEDGQGSTRCSASIWSLVTVAGAEPGPRNRRSDRHRHLS
ncbi:hypothetical protein AB0G42_29215 [Streptomyces yangpuensis]|uniref:hypothetical protein n=1 Tax=Streptomyces yangpuensis TaxID=1648182 RepID=UPI00341635E9